MQTGKSAFITLSSLLEKDSEILHALCSRADSISRLQQYLQSRLDDPLSQHVKVASYNNDTLILHTDSPAWASRLRFKIPDLLVLVHEYGMNNLNSIRIKVIQNAAGSPGYSRGMSLSDQTAKLILDTAESIKDENLRAALQRLGSHKS